MSPPVYVAIVLSPFIRLEHLTDAMRTRLEELGLTIDRDHSGFPAVRFTDADGSLLSNQSLVDTMRLLNRARVVFAEDYKQGWSPADIMRELQTQGEIHEAFISIAWQRPDQWVLKTQEAPTSRSA